jgi:hypothetical protein
MMQDSKEYYVIAVKRGNQEKFIENDFYAKHHINCTVKLNKVKKFKDEKYAQSFWDNWKEFDKELGFVGVKKIRVTYELI